MKLSDEQNNVVPIHPVPDDQEIADYLNELIGIDMVELKKLCEEYTEGEQHCIENGQPAIFVYGQALNKLRAQLKEDLVHMLAAALWELAK